MKSPQPARAFSKPLIRNAWANGKISQLFVPIAVLLDHIDRYRLLTADDELRRRQLVFGERRHRQRRVAT